MAGAGQEVKGDGVGGNRERDFCVFCVCVLV